MELLLCAGRNACSRCMVEMKETRGSSAHPSASLRAAALARSCCRLSDASTGRSQSDHLLTILVMSRSEPLQWMFPSACRPGLELATAVRHRKHGELKSECADARTRLAVESARNGHLKQADVSPEGRDEGVGGVEDEGHRDCAVRLATLWIDVVTAPRRHGLCSLWSEHALDDTDVGCCFLKHIAPFEHTRDAIPIVSGFATVPPEAITKRHFIGWVRTERYQCLRMWCCGHGVYFKCAIWLLDFRA